MRTAGLGPLRDLLSAAQETMALLGGSLLSAPGEAAELWSRAAASLVTAEGVRAFDYVLVLFLVAAGLEWLFWSYAWPLARGLETAEPRLKLGVYKVVAHRGASASSASSSRRWCSSPCRPASHGRPACRTWW
jgi:hypothetical protein